MSLKDKCGKPGGESWKHMTPSRPGPARPTGLVRSGLQCRPSECSQTPTGCQDLNTGDFITNTWISNSGNRGSGIQGLRPTETETGESWSGPLASWPRPHGPVTSEVWPCGWGPSPGGRSVWNPHTKVRRRGGEVLPGEWSANRRQGRESLPSGGTQG